MAIDVGELPWQLPLNAVAIAAIDVEVTMGDAVAVAAVLP